MAIYIGKKGVMRLYDATATPNYAIVKFHGMNATIPEGHPSVEEQIRLNRGILDTDGHYTQGLDDAIMVPMQCSFSFMLASGASAKELIQEFIGLRFASGQDATWNAGSGNTALVTTKGTSTGRKAGLSGSLVVLPLFTDPKKGCLNVEVLWDEGASDVGRRLTEVWFPPDEQSLNEAPDGVTCNMQGQIYGNVTMITAFTAGTELT